MKIRKIFAGMAASAIALSMMAITASAAGLSGNAGVEFQTNTSWNFRDWYGTGSGDAEFPGSKVGVQGGCAYGDADISDAAINGSGDYTVSISASGKVTEKGTATDAEKYWNPVDKNTTVTREGSPWSMAGNYKAVYASSFEGKEADVKQSDVTWEIDVTTDKFNMLGVTTDIAGEYDEDDDGVVHFYLDSDHKQEVKVTKLSVDLGGTSYTCADDEIMLKDDLDYLGIAVINTYGESSIDKKAAAPESGTVSISFHLELVDAGAGDTSSADTSSTSGGSGSSGSSGSSTTSSASDTSSAADSTSSGDDWTPTATDGDTDKSLEDALNAVGDDESAASGDSSSNSTAAASATSTTDGGTSTTTTTTTTTTTGGGSTTTTTGTGTGVSIGDVSSSEAASDATENAKAGVSAGVALGFLALAGAIAVVAKKK